MIGFQIHLSKSQWQETGGHWNLVLFSVIECPSRGLAWMKKMKYRSIGCLTYLICFSIAAVLKVSEAGILKDFVSLQMITLKSIDLLVLIKVYNSKFHAVYQLESLHYEQHLLKQESLNAHQYIDAKASYILFGLASLKPCFLKILLYLKAVFI